MLLILEIIFTVTAWRKGWRWRALLPFGLPIFVGVIWGLSLASSGGTIQDAQRLVQEIQGLAIFLDLVCLGALITMTFKAPKKASKPGYHHHTVPAEQSESNGGDNGADFLEVEQYASNHRS
jgi:hypothetical protein